MCLFYSKLHLQFRNICWSHQTFPSSQAERQSSVGKSAASGDALLMGVTSINCNSSPCLKFGVVGGCGYHLTSASEKAPPAGPTWASSTRTENLTVNSFKTVSFGCSLGVHHSYIPGKVPTIKKKKVFFKNRMKLHMHRLGIHKVSM